MDIRIHQTSLFIRQKKKLKKNQIDELDKAILAICDDPMLGEEKTGDLRGIHVYKFKIFKQEYLLAYEWDPETRSLIALGVHENFYRDLKQYWNS